MKGAIETAFGIIVMAFMVIVGTSYITASLNTQRAQNYHSAVVAEIEASDFSDDVISELKTKAKNNGYTSLTINKQTSTSGKEYAEVVLDYKYNIPILAMFMDHEIVGYAR